jgi:hypothetical protein
MADKVKATPKPKKVEGFKGAVTGALGGKPKSGSKDGVKEMHIQHSASGGHVIHHVHHNPDKDETHTTKSDTELMKHVMQHMGQGDGTAAPDGSPMAAPASAGSPDMAAGGADAGAGGPAGASGASPVVGALANMAPPAGGPAAGGPPPPSPVQAA